MPRHHHFVFVLFLFSRSSGRGVPAPCELIRLDRSADADPGANSGTGAIRGKSPFPFEPETCLGKTPLEAPATLRDSRSDGIKLLP